MEYSQPSWRQRREWSSYSSNYYYFVVDLIYNIVTMSRRLFARFSVVGKWSKNQNCESIVTTKHRTFGQNGSQ